MLAARAPLIEAARSALTQLDAPVLALAECGRVCVSTRSAHMIMSQPPSDELRAWMLRVDSMCTQIAAFLPRVTFTRIWCLSLFGSTIILSLRS